MLTPEEIQAREFLVSLRGYDRDEVHSFLEQVAGQIRDLQLQLEGMQAGQPTVQLPEEGSPGDLALSLQSASESDPKPFFEDLSQTTQRILEAAYESAAEIQRKARSRADRELANAQSQAEKLVAEGERRREVIEGLVEMLEERRAALAEDLRGIAKIVEQMLTDFAPRGELPTSDKPLTVTETPAPDEDLTPENDDDLGEAELDTTAEESEPAPVAQPAAETAELAEVDDQSGASPDDEEPAECPDEHASQTTKRVSPNPLTVSRLA